MPLRTSALTGFASSERTKDLYALYPPSRIKTEKPPVSISQASALLRIPPRQQCSRTLFSFFPFRLISRRPCRQFRQSCRARPSLAASCGPMSSRATCRAASEPLLAWAVPTASRSSSDNRGRLSEPGICAWAYSEGERTSMSGRPSSRRRRNSEGDMYSDMGRNIGQGNGNVSTGG